MEVDIACVGLRSRDGRVSDHADRRLEREPRRSRVREPRRTGHAAAGALLRARRRSCRRGERRGDPRPGNSLELSRARPGRDSHGRRGEAGAGLLFARSRRRQPAALRAAVGRFFPSSRKKVVPEGRCLRAAVDALLSAQERRAGAFHRPVQPVGRLATDGQRPGADLAGQPGERAALLGQEGGRAPPRRSGSGQERSAGRGLHGRDGRARTADRGRRRPGGRGRQSPRPKVRSPRAARASGRWA